ncbi:MAG: Uma2 family endonuclease [Chloroflexota bacterium]
MTTPTPAKAPSTPFQMSYAAYLDWSDEHAHAEWVPIDSDGNGEVILLMPPTLSHQQTSDFLSTLLRLFVSLFQLGKIVTAPFEMKLGPGLAAREPDILFVSKAHSERLTEERLNGPADLIIEIVSKSSVKRDRDAKYREYRNAGVGEYWVINPRFDQQRADFYRLTPDGEYELFATEEDDKIVSTTLPGFWLNPDWLWQTGKLDPFPIFCEIVGLPENVAQQIQTQMKANIVSVQG